MAENLPKHSFRRMAVAADNPAGQTPSSQKETVTKSDWWGTWSFKTKMPAVNGLIRSRAWKEYSRPLLLGLSFIALTVYFYSPVRETMDTSLDSSNYSSYAYFTAHGFQYGTDIVPMAGPYGFVLYGWTFSGELFWTRAICALGLEASLAALTLWFFVRNRGSWWRWGWLAAHLAFTPFHDDLLIEWTLLLAGLFLLQASPQRLRTLWTLPVVGLVSFLSLVKGTHLVLGLATLGVVAVGYAWQFRWKRLLLLGGSYLGFLFLFWVLAGQNILHLATYFRGIGELAGGYNDAMSLEEPTRVFVRGVLVSAGLIIGLAWSLWVNRRNSATTVSLLLLAGFGFVQWKHGFVRADGHAYIFFNYALVAAIAAYLVGYPAPEMRPTRLAVGTTTALLLLTLITACWGYGERELLLPSARAFEKIVPRFVFNLRQVVNLTAVKSDFDGKLIARRDLHAMPLVRHEVGRHTIDLFGFEHGLLTLNGLNYHPRPMGGGPFNVYTPGLMQLNRSFLHDLARRPDYYLLKIQTLDDRLMALDDGLALTDLLYGYRPVLVEHDHLLLKALSHPVNPELRSIAKKTFRFGDIVPVPAVGANEVLIARFGISPNLLGRIRNAVYKLPRVWMGLRGQSISQPERRRIVPAMAGSPFILSPVIENTRDWIGLFTNQPGKSLATFRVSTSDRTWFSKSLTVEFFVLPWPAATPDGGIDALLPFTETTIESVTTTLPSGEPVRLIGQLMNPPNSFSWALNGDERSVSFGYGMIPAAYTEGHTDGVEFSTTLQPAGQPPLELFHRRLAPGSRMIDQGHHTVELALPIFKKGTRIAIAANAGPHNDTSWDWAYISNLHFKREEYPAASFPGFNVMPIGWETNQNSLSEIDGQPLFMLNAPSALTFALKGNEHSLQIDFGLLSGAYTGEGRTDGVDYVVEIVREGQSKKEIFRRALRPLTVAEDRGRQHATIPLLNVKQNDQLIVRTAPGPTGNISWGWAYLARLNLE